MIERESKVRLTRRAVLLAAVATFALVATPTRAEDLPKIKLGILKLGAMTNVWVAARDGIFKKNGIDVTLVEIPMPSQAISVLQSKSIDIVLQIPGTAMMAKENGFDLVLVGQNETAGTTPPVSNAILIPTGSPITSIKELKGKRIVTSSPRGQGFAAMKEVFERNGLKAEDTQLIEAPFPAHPDLLRSKQADAVIALDPYTTQIIKSGTGKALSWYMAETIPDQPVGAWWALGSWAKEHKKEIAAFQAGIAESHAYLNADPARAKKLVAEFSGLSPELVNDMPLISWKSRIDTEIWQAMTDMMTRQGELTKKHDVAEYMQ